MLKFIFSKKKPVNKEIIINAETLEKRVALLENGQLDEFHIERTNEQRLVGSIFKGRINNLEPGLKAAFVDIGFEVKPNFAVENEKELAKPPSVDFSQTPATPAPTK